jgi:hypothetical protein
VIQVRVRAIVRCAFTACVFGVLALGSAESASSKSGAIDAPANAKAPAPGNGGAPGKTALKPAAKPIWNELKPSQQHALAPLADEWNTLPASQKKKWLAISARFPSLSDGQQHRLQERMRDWVALTPEQRRVARESYSLTKKLGPNQKAAEWQQYQQLSDEQKNRLADDAARKKSITNLPPATQTKGKLVPPRKPPRNHNATSPDQATENPPTPQPITD